MHLSCPDCGAAIPADDVNIDQGLARCRACNGVINVKQAVGADKHPPVPRPRVGQPPAFTVEDLGSGVRLSYRWFTWVAVLLTVFCVAWDSFLIVRYSTAFKAGAPLPTGIFAIPLVAVGVGLTYTVLALYLNRTVLVVNDGRLTVRHGPIPWPGRRDVDLSELEQLFCEENMTRGRNGAVSYSYTVNCLLKGERRVSLLSSLPDRQKALFVEQLVEGYLGIEDRPVDGELPRQ
jgi:predicted Zn finger-like uncharacterized protein